MKGEKMYSNLRKQIWE